jgi:hypothetical protein
MTKTQRPDLKGKDGVQDPSKTTPAGVCFHILPRPNRPKIGRRRRHAMDIRRVGTKNAKSGLGAKSQNLEAGTGALTGGRRSSRGRCSSP